MLFLSDDVQTDNLPTSVTVESIRSSPFPLRQFNPMLKIVSIASFECNFRFLNILSRWHVSAVQSASHFTKGSVYGSHYTYIAVNACMPNNKGGLLFRSILITDTWPFNPAMAGLQLGARGTFLHFSQTLKVIKKKLKNGRKEARP